MPEPALEEQGIWSDLRPLLDEELSRLPVKYRSVIVLCDLEGKTRKETARQLGVPEGTVAGQLARARAMLAKRLTQRGVPLSGGVLAPVLSQKMASAGVPTSVVASTVEAATLFAAGQSAGVISSHVAALTEGVLRSMMTNKIKTALQLVVLAIPVAGMGVGGALYKTLAAEPLAVSHVKNDNRNPSATDREKRPTPQTATAAQEGKRDTVAPKQAGDDLKAEVERLRAENKELKERLQRQARKGNAADVKLVTKAYPVSDLRPLTGPALPDQSEVMPLIRIITKTIEPKSWDEAGGDGLIEYFPAGRSLIIRQSPAILEQVEQLLEDMLHNREEIQQNEQKK